jgi:hypothetical protein
LHFEEGDNGGFGNLYYDKINESKENRMIWETDMKNKFAEILKVRPEDVHIITCVRGSISFGVVVECINKHNLDKTENVV